MLKKKTFIAALTLSCVGILLPAVAHADGASPFDTRTVVTDYHLGIGSVGTYNSEKDGAASISSFLTGNNNKCIAIAAAEEDGAITGILNNPKYAGNLNRSKQNYAAKCGANNPSAPQFIIKNSMAGNILNNLGQKGSIDVLYFVIQSGSRYEIVPISKSNQKPMGRYTCQPNDSTCGVTYKVNLDAGCSGANDPGIAASLTDLNTDLIASQMQLAYDNSARTCTNITSTKLAGSTLDQQANSAVNALLGPGAAVNTANTGSAAAGSDNADGSINTSGAWGPAATATAGNLR